jgi:hypothetical protein
LQQQRRVDGAALALDRPHVEAVARTSERSSTTSRSSRSRPRTSKKRDDTPTCPSVNAAAYWGMTRVASEMLR